MAATIEGYISSPIFPSFWSGWGGDLATGMANTTDRYKESSNSSSKYHGKILQEIADMTIGDENSSCNYTDFCCDFDAFKLSQYISDIISNDTQKNNYHVFSEALRWYYQEDEKYRNRFNWFLEEVNGKPEFKDLTSKIYSMMTGTGERSILLPQKANSPTDEVIRMCCNSLASYIISMVKN